MKQGYRCVLPIRVDVDFEMVKSIRFLFEQGKVRLLIDYPSDKAILDTQDRQVVNLFWTQNDTWRFDPEKNVRLDTYIRLKGIQTVPETTIATFKINETAFRREEIRDE